MKMYRKFLIGAIVLGTASLALVAGANHSWGSYHWARTSNPFTLKLGDDVSTAWDSYLTTASADWSLSDVLKTSVVTGSTDPRRCKPVLGRVEVCNAKYGNNGWLGLASIWASGLHITQGTTKLNDSYFVTAKYNTPAWKQFVVCQEVGHTFGLDHQDENFSNTNLGTCMDYTNDPDGMILGQSTNLHPNQHDYDELDIIYSHLDSTTTVGATAVSGRHSDINSSDRGEWGNEIHKSKNGRSSLFERDFGNGDKLFTFVIWDK